MKNSNDNYKREKAIYQYVQALDEGDMDGIAEVLNMALYDPELARIISEIDCTYHEEEQLTSIATDAELIRTLLHQHLQSAFQESENIEEVPVIPPIEDSQPLTVGDVIKRLQISNNFNGTEKAILKNFSDSQIPLPNSLSIRSIREFFATELKQAASEKFLDLFRNQAIMLGMGQNQNNAQLAAARKQRTYQKKTNSKS